METYCVSCKRITENENSSVKKAKQSRLKIKNSTILIIFEMISLKWVKSLIGFCWLDPNLCQNCI